jgi:hypothetical protein
MSFHAYLIYAAKVARRISVEDKIAERRYKEIIKIKWDQSYCWSKLQQWPLEEIAPAKC